MPTAAERIASSRAKVARAKQHINNLQSALTRFGDTKPYDIRTQDDPESGQYSKCLVRADPIPIEIAVIVGDILFNLRSALDHIAYQLVLVGMGRATLTDSEAKKVYFPIGNDSANYVARRDTEIKAARQDAKDLIDRIEPYKGGKGEILWRLQRLNIADKHRLLLTTIAVADSAHITSWNVLKTAKDALGLPAHWAVMLAHRARTPIHRFRVTKSKHLTPGRPLEVGDVLMTGPIESKDYQRVQFVLQVALNEPGIVEGKPVLETMKQMVDAVEGILPTFEPLLS